MKISFVINEPVQNATGGYKMVYMYANSLAERGHRVSIYYQCKKERLFSNYKIPFCFKMPIASYLAQRGPKWFKLDSRVDGFAINEINDISIDDNDIIIATAVDTAEKVNNLSQSKGKKFYFIQDYENWNFSDEYVLQTYSLGMKNIVVSKWLKDIVDRYSSEESYLISNGIDTNIFYDKKLFRDNHSVVFQFRDVAMEYKGGMYSIECIEKLKKVYPDLKVRVISTNERPSVMPKFCEYYKSITPEQVSDINNRSEVFICTSVNEGFGLPGLEAMACGCAVCSTSYKGVYEYAEDGFNALLSPIRNVDDMVSNIIEIFKNADLKKRLSSNAIETGIKHSHDLMSDEFENLLLKFR